MIAWSFMMLFFLALLAAARLYVGGDTGPMHVASLVGTPVLQILGPTHPVENAPWVETPSRTIQTGAAMETRTEPVLAAALELLEDVPDLDAVFTRLVGDRKETLKLGLRITLVRLVGAGEVAHHPPYPKTRKPAAMVEEVHGLMWRDADAPHACVDHEVYRDLAALALCLLG